MELTNGMKEFLRITEETIPLFCINKETIIFKKFPEGDIIAPFPFCSQNKNTILSYQHIGQHGSADRELINSLENASVEEYQELKNELISIGYNI